MSYRGYHVDDSEERSETGESGSGSESGSSGDEATGSDEEDIKEEEDEPVLKYRRFAKEAVTSISDPFVGDGVHICCIAVHSKFIALGMRNGALKILDHTGVILSDRVYKCHTAVINQIAVDEDGEYIATCSDDKQVIIIGLFTSKYNDVSRFDKPVMSVALHPHFSKSTNHIIVVGSDRLVMIEERRWPLGSKTTDIHGGGGMITTIKWKKNLIAWANQKAVLVYDVSLRENIASISFDEYIAKNVPCSLFWQSPDILLVGRGHLVKTVTVREGDAIDSSTSGSDIDTNMPRPKKIMAITAQNTFQQFLVCGVIAIEIDNEWKLVVLGYSGNIDQDEAVENEAVPPSHLVVVSPGQYIPSMKCFSMPEHDARDKLLPKGYRLCKCEEYKLDCIPSEGRIYILTPVDMILATKRSPEDHVEWLVDDKRKDFEGAMKYLENPEVSRQLHPGRVKEIGLQYIYHLIEKKKFHEAARKCLEVIGSEDKDKERWEDIIYFFFKENQLDEIRPYIPLSKPKLSPTVYELTLNYFLQEGDYDMLYKLIKEWPHDLYKAETILNVVQINLKRDPTRSELLKVSALLHEDLEQFDAACKIYLQQGYPEIFELIHKKKLYSALLENLIQLLELGTEETIKILVDCQDDVPPKRVVIELETLGREEYLHKYLDYMFDKNPKLGGDFHEKQVELYSKYEPEKLQLFLRSCNDIPLQRALEVCEKYERDAEMVYLLDRMGNPKAALQLIINKLQDVNRAIEFTMEQDDSELWEVLIKSSIKKPRFITGLLNSVGTHIDPTRLIKEIPNQTEIPNLGASLVKLMQDFRIQVNLREGCKKILVKDSHSLMEKLVKLQERAVFIDDESICITCGLEIIGLDERTDYIIFFCGHIYHHLCVSKKNEMMLCRLCYTGSRSSTKRLGQHPRLIT